MKSELLKEYRIYYNTKIIEADSFFEEFDKIDDETGLSAREIKN